MIFKYTTPSSHYQLAIVFKSSTPGSGVSHKRRIYKFDLLHQQKCFRVAEILDRMNRAGMRPGVYLKVNPQDDTQPLNSQPFSSFSIHSYLEFDDYVNDYSTYAFIDRITLDFIDVNGDLHELEV